MTDNTAPASEVDRIVLDPGSFTGPERLDCQQHFDASFADLLSCVFEAVDPRRDGVMQIRIVDRDGVQHFPDQIIQYMLWVQSRRDRPDAELSDFDGYSLAELNRPVIDGILGKGLSTGRSNRSTPDSNSADTSPG